jgi:hypothetical protein
MFVLPLLHFYIKIRRCSLMPLETFLLRMGQKVDSNPLLTKTAMIATLSMTAKTGSFFVEPLAHVHADANDVGKGSYYRNINCLVKAVTLTSSLPSRNSDENGLAFQIALDPTTNSTVTRSERILHNAHKFRRDRGLGSTAWTM